MGNAPRLGSAALRERLLRGGEVALLDVREARPFAAGHILTASNVPLSRLELRVGRLVPRKATEILLTDGGDGLAERAASALAGLGYADPVVHDGGAPAWKAAGFELFEGVNVPSKAFGEIVEAVCGTPALDAAEVKARIDSGEDLIVLDGRPWDEYREFCIPGGIDCPNSELAYRLRDLAPDPETVVVVNCAGRTRSIVGAQTLRNVGAPNPVFALRNGTIGWEWAGFELERGATRRYGPVSDEARAWSRERCDALARRAGVETIGLDDLDRWRAEADARTLYVLDVRAPEEYALGTLPGAASAPGVQLVQATDEWIAVRDARIVLVDDTGVRARVTAHWLRQAGYPDAVVLDADARDRAEAVPRPPRPDAPAVAPSVAAGRTVLDLSSSLAFVEAHPAGAFWGLRSRLDEVAAALPPGRPVALLDDEDGRLAALAAADLAARGIEASLLDGGLAAWTSAGLAAASGRDGMLCAMDDIGDLSSEPGDDPEAAARRYIEWELGLPRQIERDGLLTFDPLVGDRFRRAGASRVARKRLTARADPFVESSRVDAGTRGGKAAMNRKTGFLMHELYLWHDTGSAALWRPAGLTVQPGEHAENAETKRRFRNLLEVAGLYDELVRVDPRPATREEILAVHTADYVDGVVAMSAERGGDAGEATPFGRGSYEIALLAAGGTIAMVDAVVEGRIDNGYALVRPPGHHAEPDIGRGFCIFGNIGVAIRHARRVHGVERAAVVDWDVHHGNGTQRIFYEDPDVLTISIHQDNWYPADSGHLHETGAGAGEGFNINAPLPPGSGRDAYVQTFERVVAPALRRFRPQLIVIASGFDASIYDPLGRMMVTASTYRRLTRIMLDLADELTGGKLVLSHEGGYSAAYVPYCGLAVMEELSGVSTGVDDVFARNVDECGGQGLYPHQDETIRAAAALAEAVPRA